jgi:5-methylcytosine-specific restriction protein A
MPTRPTPYHPYRARQQSNWGSNSTRDQRLSGRALQVRNNRIKVRDRYRCQNKQCNLITDQLQVDHKLALAAGGIDDDSNLQCLCEMCHKIKSRLESFGKRLRDPSSFPLSLTAAKREVVKAKRSQDDEWGELGLPLIGEDT